MGDSCPSSIEQHNRKVRLSAHAMGAHKFKWQSEGAAVIDLTLAYLARLLGITIPRVRISKETSLQNKFQGCAPEHDQAS
jgi:hypothetical protein